MWNEMKLTVVDFDKLPKQHKVLGFFPHSKLTPEQTLQMLGAMNMCLDASCWSILTCKHSEKGTHIAFGINRDQLSILHERKFKLFFGAGSALFRNITKKMSDSNAQNPSEPEHDIQTSEMEFTTDDDDNITVIIPANSQQTANASTQQPITTTVPAQNPMDTGAAAVEMTVETGIAGSNDVTAVKVETSIPSTSNEGYKTEPGAVTNNAQTQH